jgi:hypothetical protein
MHLKAYKSLQIGLKKFSEFGTKSLFTTRSLSKGIFNNSCCEKRKHISFIQPAKLSFEESTFVVLESILPNFFLCKTKIFLLFATNLGHFNVQTIFSYATSTQA